MQNLFHVKTTQLTLGIPFLSQQIQLLQIHLTYCWAVGFKGLGNFIACKRFTIQTLWWSIRFLILNKSRAWHYPSSKLSSNIFKCKQFILLIFCMQIVIKPVRRVLNTIYFFELFSGSFIVGLGLD